MNSSRTRLTRSLNVLIAAALLISWSFSPVEAGKVFPKIDKVDLSKFPRVSAYVSFYDEYGNTIRSMDPDKMDISVSINVIPDKVLKLKEPLSVSFLLDKSGSMRESMKHLKQASERFVSLLDKTDRIEIISFDRDIHVHQAFSYAKRNLVGKISKLYGKGSTALYDALYKAAERINDQPGNRVIILITDGKDQIRDGSGPMSKRSLEETLRFLRMTGVPVITIGLGDKADIKTLKTIAHYTNGSYYFAPSKYQLEALYESIAKNLTSQFKMEFTSPYPVRDGSWRKLRVQGQHGLDMGEAEKWYSIDPEN